MCSLHTTENNASCQDELDGSNTWQFICGIEPVSQHVFGCREVVRKNVLPTSHPPALMRSNLLVFMPFQP